MATGHAFVLNLDADLELAVGAGYAPKRSVLEAMRPHVERLSRALLGPSDVLVGDGTPTRGLVGLPGRAFCPTPRALATLVRTGAVPEPHPSFDVLRRVNSRAFASALGTTLPGAELVRSLDEASAKLASDPGLGAAWRVKRLYGMTGRGQRRLRPGAVVEGDLAFLRAGLAEGGLQIEPDVPLDTEYAIHGVLSFTGELALGSPVTQRCDARGAWLATERIEDEGAHGEVLRELREEAGRVAGALMVAGYHGPFGIDAFTYRDRAGRRRFQPRSEINARYSMGFCVGFLGRPI